MLKSGDRGIGLETESHCVTLGTLLLLVPGTGLSVWKDAD